MCVQCNQESKYSTCRKCQKKNTYIKNKDKILAKNRAYGQRWRKTDRYKEYLSEYKRLNKDKLNEYKRIYNSGRRAKLREGKVSVEEWNTILKSQNFCCTYCRIEDRKLTIDHIVPLSKGGLHTKENVCGACMKCNLSKRAKDLSEWLTEIQ